MQDFIVYILLGLTIIYVGYKTYLKLFPKDSDNICGSCGGCDLKKSCSLHNNLEKIEKP
jgi:hypothetical protein